MNYLAHLALSERNQSIMVGNYIADFVKGKRYLDYPEAIQAGIILHRKIDFFTDTHPLIGEAVGLITEVHGKFSGILVDMYLDYFLARHFESIYNTSLVSFQSYVFTVLEAHWDILPEKVQMMYEYMKKGEWLVRYGEKEGLQKSLYGLSRRIKHENNIDQGIADLSKHEDSLEQIFLKFYPEIQKLCSTYLSKNLAQ